MAKPNERADGEPDFTDTERAMNDQAHRYRKMADDLNAQAMSMYLRRSRPMKTPV